MFKNIVFLLSSLYILTLAPVTFAADDPASQETVPAEIVPATLEPATPPANAAVRQTSINTRPVNENHTDYRYCLDLKTNIEIAQCRYKKK